LKFIREHSLFILILGASVVLRFLPLLDYQFTLDELSGLNRTRFDSFSELIEKGVKIDAHPALIQVLIFYLVKLFGFSNWIIKLPFLLFSLGATVYAYRFGLRNFSKRVGLFASAVFSFSLVFVFYSPIARMYISGVFFSMALLFHFYEIVFLKNTKTSQFVLLGCFALLSALNQHINALFALSVCMSGLFYLSKTTRKPYLLTCILTVSVYLPHLPITLYQLGVGGIGLEQGGWLEKPEWYSVFYFLRLLFGTGKTYWFILAILLIKFLFDGPVKLQAKQTYLAVLFFFNYWVVYQYSIHFSPVYQHSVMLFSGVAVILFVCSFFDFKRDLLFYPSLSLLTAGLLYTSYIKKDFFNQTITTVFEYQFQRTFEYQREYGAENIYPVFFDADEFMRDLYFDKYNGKFNFQMSSDSGIQSTAAFNALLASLKQELLILSSATPVHEAMARLYFPYLIENTGTQANKYKVFAKSGSDKQKTELGEKILFESSIHTGLNFRFHSASAKEDGKYTQLVDSSNEFPLDCRMKYSDVVKHEGNYVLLSLKGKAIRMPEKDLQVCISVTDDLSKETYQYTASSARSAYFSKDSGFVLTAGLFAGSKHTKFLTKPCTINFYLWNRAGETFQVKDLTIRVVDYWPEKWGFWK